MHTGEHLKRIPVVRYNNNYNYCYCTTTTSTTTIYALDVSWMQLDGSYSGRLIRPLGVISLVFTCCQFIHDGNGDDNFVTNVTAAMVAASLDPLLETLVHKDR